MAGFSGQKDLRFGQGESSPEEDRRGLGMKLSELFEMVPALRHLEGCPVFSKQSLESLSVPPYYTACPNPFLESFLSTEDAGQETLSPPPFSADVSEVRSGPIYDMHSYHTKVPPEAIARYILHYTRPGDIVLDGFCGTGMTGVAAQLCGFPPEHFKKVIESETPQPRWGPRRALLIDLSPYATFIAANLNLEIDPLRFTRAANALLSEATAKVGWMYEIEREFGIAEISHTLWSEMLLCPGCGSDFDFWSVCVNHEAAQIRDSFLCPSCGQTLSKRECNRATETVIDPVLRQPLTRILRKPVTLNYRLGSRRFEGPPSKDDLAILDRIQNYPLPKSVPIQKMMFKDGAWGDMHRSGYHFGISHVHHFYTLRNLIVVGTLWDLAGQAEKEISVALKFLVSSYNLAHSTLMTRMIFKKNSTKPVLTGYQTGALYVGSLSVEKNILSGLKRMKLPKFRKGFATLRRNSNLVRISTQSITGLKLPPNSVDYIFVDPPFGDNIKYSEVSFIAEAWLGCFSSPETEAIISKSQNKDASEYLRLMEQGFRTLFNALKPGRWMTVEFHNSQNRIWNVIQEAIVNAGFVVADVRTLDKRQGSFKQVTTARAVRQDLIISAYKPPAELENRIHLGEGSEEIAWEFVSAHLMKLPTFVSRKDEIEVIAERQNYLLFDRMVAFHVQRGVTVPLSAAEFYAGLAQRFPERDGMYFLSEQVAEYDKKRMTVREVLQLELFVTDEASAIQWLKQQLIKKPQTFQELHPQFLKEIAGWERHETTVELLELLEQNFLRYDGKGEVPSQIHSYLSTNFKELRNLPKDDEDLRAKGKDRWYVPDPNKTGDLEQLRERSLLKEFQGYVERTKKFKRNERFRMEAVRAGFKKAWQERDYEAIISVARKIPEKILQEDPKLLMWYDQALTRTGEDT